MTTSMEVIQKYKNTHAYIQINEYNERKIPIQTKVTNKYNTNVSSKQTDGGVTETGREKREEWRG